jgi:outer membrane protein OmpA-like peptidoglycan-associated protein
VAVLAALVMFAAPAAYAQAPDAAATPTAEQMIEKLTPPPRTRSLRNLTVEAVPPASLSLLIQFDFDSARVRAESRPALANLAIAMKSDKLASAKFAIEGHTDAKGRADYNLRLSQQRAEAVRDLLRAEGVDATRLVASGKGSAEPANKDDPMAAENRRVRIVNLE